MIGILFNAVPCVLPVIPLKVMGFYEVSKHDRGRCLFLVLACSAAASSPSSPCSGC